MPKYFAHDALVLKKFVVHFSKYMYINSDTYQRIQTQRNQKWNYERYALVKEFQRVPVVPMPLGALVYVYYINRWLYRKIKKCSAVADTKPGTVESFLD